MASTTTQAELRPPPTDAISAVRFGRQPSSSRLLVASWDRHVYLYETQAAAAGQLLRTIAHRAPVLDVCFGAADAVAYSAGLDHDVRRLDLETGQQTVLSSHGAGVKAVAYSPETDLLISASWDKTLHVHDLTDGGHDRGDASPALAIALPHKPFSISLTASKLVVAMASRVVYIYELATLAQLVRPSASASHPPPSSPSPSPPITLEPWQVRESSLKFMTRCVACMPGGGGGGDGHSGAGAGAGAGYASGSIEGRIAVEWFDASAASQARKYAFKCHRQTQTPLEAEAADGDPEPVDVVYPVHALAFHPVHDGSFASGGGDGVVALWDGVAKRRIRQYQRYPASVAALAFSADGRWLAVACCRAFEDADADGGGGGDGEAGGGGEAGGDRDGQPKIFLRHLSETEAKGKGGEAKGREKEKGKGKGKAAASATASSSSAMAMR
ncbi:MAG: hypothetical protein M1826_003048 [Phylliscum demangeonii]|nr:MAG: hypothetical protein M1826_003048 [Phylliscum demangeonii]